MTERVKLYASTASPFACRVVMALNLKGVRYERIEEKLWDKSPELLKYNPVHKKVPVLVHNEKPISESLVIVEYIDETWKGNSILPENPHERAHARFWAKFIDDKFYPAYTKAFFNKGEEQQNGLEEASALLKILEDELKGKRFFGGDKMGLVDVAASLIGYWIGVLEEAAGVELLTKEKFPKLTKWVDDYVNCSVVKESLPPRDVLVTFFRGRISNA